MTRARLPRSRWHMSLSGLRLMDLSGYQDAIAWRYWGIVGLGLRGHQGVVTINPVGLHVRLRVQVDEATWLQI